MRRERIVVFFVMFSFVLVGRIFLVIWSVVL